MSHFRIRTAAYDDDPAVAELARTTWRADVTPGARPDAGDVFFKPGVLPEEVLVAVEGEGSVIGYVRVCQSLPIPSHSHVLEISGLAVTESQRRRGVGRALVEAAIQHARTQRAHKLSLRVLAPNVAARTLYASHGFVEEGKLRAEFLISGEPVDDVLMALHDL